jgi:hypothetical protein
VTCGKLAVVSIREFFLENFAGDLEYHPRRAALYLGLGVAAACFWILTPSDAKFARIPLVFALGSLTLLGKGVFLLRGSSEGLGLSDRELKELAGPAGRKPLPSISAQVAQVVQDFGTGALLLWPLLNLGKDIDQSWTNPPLLSVFLSGGVLFSIGWLVRRFTTPRGA